jgi:hypothetical protein
VRLPVLRGGARGGARAGVLGGPRTAGDAGFVAGRIPVWLAGGATVGAVPVAGFVPVAAGRGAAGAGVAGAAGAGAGAGGVVGVLGT